MIGQTITTKDIAALRAHVALQQQAQSSGDLHLADELGIQFHLLLAKLIRNPVLEEIHRELMSRERVITALYKADFDYPCLLNEHHAIINHLEKKDRLNERKKSAGISLPRRDQRLSVAPCG
ncbi:FCD domain-containing protein [Undibacterium arcticum]